MLKDIWRTLPEQIQDFILDLFIYGFNRFIYYLGGRGAKLC